MSHDPLDDDAIAQLVRDVAEGWTMPAVRLDAPSWRDRIRGPRGRWIDAARGWFGRIGQAATAAVALTVVAALVAVVLTRPLQPGRSPGQSSDSTPGPSAAALPTGLPKLVLEGDLPNPSKVVVETEQGDFALVDLEKGSIGRALTGGRHGSALRVLADRSMVCLCLAESQTVGDSPTVAAVTLNHYSADGTLLSSTPIETFTGEPDPRDPVALVPERPPHVLTALAFTSDGRFGLVGWSLRAHPVWKSGIIVVDLATGDVVDRFGLPDAGTGEGDTRRVTDAPHVVGASAGGGLLLARQWFTWSPVTSRNASYRFDNDVFTATFADGRLSGLTAVPDGAGCGETILRGGPVGGGGTWLACASGGSSTTVIRRLGPDGSRLGDTPVAGRSGIEGDMTAPSPDGEHLFVWNPVSATLTRVDLATGGTTTGQGEIPAAATRGPLAAFGDWLAPTAAAKSFLRGGVVISPDGSRVYAIGVRSVSTGPEAGGSTGVFVFDGSSLASVGHWDPTADFASLAVSADGTFLYAAGLPGVGTRGNDNPRMSASITVFDTGAGAPRLIAGLLGGEMLAFPTPILD